MNIHFKCTQILVCILSDNGTVVSDYLKNRGRVRLFAKLIQENHREMWKVSCKARGYIDVSMEISQSFTKNENIGLNRNKYYCIFPIKDFAISR